MYYSDEAMTLRKAQTEAVNANKCAVVALNSYHEAITALEDARIHLSEARNLGAHASYSALFVHSVSNCEHTLASRKREHNVMAKEAAKAYRKLAAAWKAVSAK